MELNHRPRPGRVIDTPPSRLPAVFCLSGDTYYVNYITDSKARSSYESRVHKEENAEMKPLAVVLVAGFLFGVGFAGSTLVNIDAADAACPAHDLKCKEQEGTK